MNNGMYINDKAMQSMQEIWSYLVNVMFLKTTFVKEM